MPYGVTAPIGMAEWKTAISPRAYPPNSIPAFPTVEELEAELACEPGGVAHQGDG